jgi:hypothetical protein
MDVELPGIAPAPDNGWNSVYTSPCSEVVRQSYVPIAVDRADFNGFAAYIAAHSSYKVGVYSSPGVWTSIFGTGTDSLIPDTYEWTYEPETASLSKRPVRMVPEVRGVRAVLRWPDQLQPVRAHVAVVRRRRDQERSRGLRPDRRRQAGLTGVVLAGLAP